MCFCLCSLAQRKRSSRLSAKQGRRGGAYADDLLYGGINSSRRGSSGTEAAAAATGPLIDGVPAEGLLQVGWVGVASRDWDALALSCCLDVARVLLLLLRGEGGCGRLPLWRYQRQQTRVQRDRGCSGSHWAADAWGASSSFAAGVFCVSLYVS